MYNVTVYETVDEFLDALPDIVESAEEPPEIVFDGIHTLAIELEGVKLSPQITQEDLIRGLLEKHGLTFYWT
jgi:hypothetical protein